MALKTKNKLQFIDGTLPRPEPRCSIVCIVGQMQYLSSFRDQSDLTSINCMLRVYCGMKMIEEAWKDLKDHYYQGEFF